MAWNAPVLHVTNDIISAADYNFRYYNERYLKGLDGPITLSDQLTSTAKASHVDGLGTHTHASAGAEGGQLDWDNIFSDAVHGHSSDAEGGKLSGAILAAASGVGPLEDDSYFYYAGGGTVPARIRLYGRSHATLPGRLELQVPNFAGVDWATVAWAYGRLDAPDLNVVNNITMQSGMTVDGVDISALDTAVDTVTPAAPARTITTVYQNTSGKILFVTITVEICLTSTSGLGVAIVSCDANAAPSTVVAKALLNSNLGMVSGDAIYAPISFMVPNNYYYKLTATETDATVAVEAWHEWTLH